MVTTNATSYANNAWHFAYVRLGWGLQGATVTLSVDGTDSTAPNSASANISSSATFRGYWHLGWGSTALTGGSTAFFGVTGGGRLVQAAPVLVVGGLLTAGAVLLVRRRGKLPVGMLGASLTLAVAIVVYQPLIGAQLLGSESVGKQAVRATYVSTGLLPVKISAPDDGGVVLHPGQHGAVTTTHVVGGRLSLDIRPAVPWWFWLVLLLGSFAPSAATAVVGAAERPRGRRILVVPAA